MSEKRVAWLDRVFACGLPIEMFANTLERVSGTPARLEDKLNRLSQDTLANKTDDQWSILEHAGHLLTLEELWLGRMQDYAEGAQQLRPWDGKNKATREADYNSWPLGKILTAFRAEREKLTSLLRPAQPAQSAQHPRLDQSMRIIDMAYFIAEHDDHHLASISELLITS